MNTLKSIESLWERSWLINFVRDVIRHRVRQCSLSLCTPKDDAVRSLPDKRQTSHLDLQSMTADGTQQQLMGSDWYMIDKILKHKSVAVPRTMGRWRRKWLGRWKWRYQYAHDDWRICSRETEQTSTKRLSVGLSVRRLWKYGPLWYFRLEASRTATIRQITQPCSKHHTAVNDIPTLGTSTKIHNPFTLSSPAWNLPFSQILPTVDCSPEDCLYDRTITRSVS